MPSASSSSSTSSAPSIVNRLSALASSMGDINMYTDKDVLLAILPFPEPKELFEQIREKHPNLEIIYLSAQISAGSIKSKTVVPDELFEKATVLVTLASFPSSPKLVPNLRFIHLLSAGANQVTTHPIYTDSNIPITTSSGIHGPMISEWVIMQTLIHSHKARLLLEWQNKREWGGHGNLQDLDDWVGRRVGVLGYGSIGRQVGHVFNAMGAEIYAYTASPRTTPESKKDRGYIVPGTGDVEGVIPKAWFSGLDKPSLHNFLKQDLDIIIVAVPLTKETEHFIGAEEFKILGKKNALVVNIARGSILKQDDLIAALKTKLEDGGLRGAALDVTDPEPLPADSELWGLENVTVTPHISGLGRAYLSRSLEVLQINLDNAEAGRRLINVVDRRKGY